MSKHDDIIANMTTDIDEPEAENVANVTDEAPEELISEALDTEFVEDNEPVEGTVGPGGNIGTAGNEEPEGNSEPATRVPTLDMLIGAEDNTDGTPSVVSVLNGMVDSIDRLSLINTLTLDIGDELLKYADKEGEVDELKIPDALFQVAIAFEVAGISRRKSWRIAKRSSGIFYLYNGFYWGRVEDDQMEHFAASIAIKMGFYSPAKARTSGFRKSLLKQIQADAEIMPDFDTKSTTTLINVLNGTLAINADGVKFQRHNPDDFQLYVLPFEYDRKATAPLFKKYFDRVLPDKTSQQVLLEFAGYVFTKHLKLEKALLLYGGGANGKSVWYEVHTAMLGEHNVATKSLGDLMDSDGGNDARAKLADKLLNYGSEIRAKDVDADILKNLISGESVSAREKYKTSIDLRNQCKLMFNANTLPRGMERTHALYRRFIIVPFDQTIPESEQDPQLHTKIIGKELPGVLNIVIEALNTLLATKKFTPCAVIEAALDKYKLENNPVLQFIQEKEFVNSLTETRTIAGLYAEYREWCADSGHRPLAKNNFSKEMEDNGLEKSRNSVGIFFYIEENVANVADAPPENNYFGRKKREEQA